MNILRSNTMRALATSAVLVLVTTAVGWSPSAGDTAPANPGTPETVAADALPTVQVNGVVWSQTLIGNTVYAVGSFTRARPAGAAAGTQEVVRNNAVAYDITTGAMTAWAPSLNAQGLAITRSPDGSRLYVGGDFTTVNGATRSRIAALSPSTGTVISAFNSRSDAKVKAIAATATTVYFGGLTSNVGGVARTRAAALRASDGALQPWNPNIQGGGVNALAVSADGTQVAIGGAFTSVNGSTNPGYGLASVDASSGTLKPWAINATVRDAGPNSAITSLTSDGNSLYGTGYVYGSGGNNEGTWRASWTGGTLEWIEDCKGDTYSVFPRTNDVYKSSHAHECLNNGDFPNRQGPWWNWHGLAFSKAATGVMPRGPFTGLPKPSLLHWYPQFTNGKATGQNQATWHVTGNSTYVVMGGEFPTVNGTAQQGLVRFAAKGAAPNKRGGMLTGSKLNPTLTALGGGSVRLTWPSNWDQDNQRLTYKVIRDSNNAAPVHTVAADSSFWQLPTQTWTDTGLVAGRSYRYRVFSVDPLGNETRSDTVTVTAQ